MLIRDDALLLALFEVLIPADAGRGLPSAAMPGLPQVVRDRLATMEGIDDLIEASLQCLCDQARARDPGGLSAIPAGERVEMVQATEAEQPFGLGALMFNLFAAYYQQPEVLEALGLPGRAPFPQGFDLPGDDEIWFEKAAARARA